MSSPGKRQGRARTCCFMVLVSHSSSLPGTWLVPLLPMSGAEMSTWGARLGAAAEQTKEAPLGLHARDRILQHTWGGVSAVPAHKGRMGRGEGSAEGQVRRAPGGGGASSPGHVVIDVDFTEILLGFCVIKAHCPHTTAQQELE